MVASAAGAQRGKASFDDIYAAPDPRAYYEGLGSLGYEVPQHGWHVFSAALDALDVERPTVVDLCSSYGVNAALLKHDLDLDDLYRHYRASQHADLTPDEFAEIDREFFAQHRRDDAPRVIGVDVAAPAIDYAVRVGLLDAGRAENLETAAPSAELGEHLAAADLITVTGGVGYITERTFDGILDCAEESARQPWVASLCLRTVSYEPISDCLASHGLVTEQLPEVTFPQRRFASDAEREYALSELSALGVDPAGKEAEGRYHVDVYLSRPRDEVDDLTISELLGEVAVAM
jgi:hypothetical protein